MTLQQKLFGSEFFTYPSQARNYVLGMPSSLRFVLNAHRNVTISFHVL